MATLRDYFDTAVRHSFSVHADWKITDQAGNFGIEVRARVVLDLEGNAKYWSFFLPGSSDVFSCIDAIYRSSETARCILSSHGDSALVKSGFAGYSEYASSETLIFTKRIHLYVDITLTPDLRKSIADRGLEYGFHVLVYDKDYAAERSSLERPLAFMCYDSRDREPLVRSLVIELAKLMCPVWYDEYSLGIGDSLRENIERGLRETPKCVVILSPYFLSNTGWTKAEFDSIYTREILEKQNVILPVWHNVSVREIYEYSPRLADKVGLNSSLGVEQLAQKLARAIKP